MSGSSNKIDELRAAVAQEPGAEAFVELANILAEDPGTRGEAREICFRGLTDNPQSHRGRITLARLYYLDGYGEFSIRELVELKRRVSLSSLDRLIELFGGFAKPFLMPVASAAGGPANAASKSSTAPRAAAPEDDVVAEMDIDDEFLEALEELEEGK